MKKLFKKLTVVTVVAAMVCGLAACGGSKQEASTEAAKESTKLVLGTSADYPPFEFVMLDDKGEQQYAGIDLSASQKIAEDMGKELEVVNMSFDNLMTALQKGEVDMVAAALDVTEERKAVADFSDVYYTDYPPMLLIKADKKDVYTSVDALKGKTVGAQTGTTKAAMVTEKIPGATLLGLSVVTEMVNNLEYDKCDALLLDGAVALKYAEQNDSMVIADIEFGETLPYCIAVQKGDPKGLLESMNKTIASAIDEGLVEKWTAQADEDSAKAVE